MRPTDGVCNYTFAFFKSSHTAALQSISDYAYQLVDSCIDHQVVTLSCLVLFTIPVYVYRRQLVNGFLESIWNFIHMPIDWFMNSIISTLVFSVFFLISFFCGPPNTYELQWLVTTVLAFISYGSARQNMQWHKETARRDKKLRADIKTIVARIDNAGTANVKNEKSIDSSFASRRHSQRPKRSASPHVQMRSLRTYFKYHVV
jgi:hypothetical protein